MSKPQKVKLFNSRIIAHLKTLGINIDISAKGQDELEDTPFNRLQVWFSYTKERRTEVRFLSHPLVHSPQLILIKVLRWNNQLVPPTALRLDLRNRSQHWPLHILLQSPALLVQCGW
jgi:hypothetical protein